MSLLVKIEEEEAVSIRGVNTNEEEEDKEAVFIRGVNTDEDSPNAQHAPGGGGGGGCLY